MGTEISLNVSDMTVCWSKNSLGIDHGGLFQEGDHYVNLNEGEGSDDGDDSASADYILYNSVLRKPLSEVKCRLEMLGFTIENAEKEYELLVKNIIANEDSYSEYAGEGIDKSAGLMAFSEFLDFMNGVSLNKLNNEFISCGDSHKEMEMIKGRFNNDDFLKRIPLYGDHLNNAWSEKSTFGTLIGILHPYTTMRLLSENEENLSEYVTWDYGALVSNGWANIADINTGARRANRFLIVTEGSSDSHILKKALRLLRPDIEDFFYFIDVDAGHPFPGTGNLIKFADGLVKIDIQNLTLFVLDNDSEGIDAYRRIKQMQLPHNIDCIHLPDLNEFEKFPTVGPNGLTEDNINGRAVAIECFLDLTYTEHEKAMIRWSNYKKDMDTYQGALENKDYYTKKFMKLKQGGEDYESYDLSKMATLVDCMIKACSNISSRIRLMQLESMYPE